MWLLFHCSGKGEGGFMPRGGFGISIIPCPNHVSHSLSHALSHHFSHFLFRTHNLVMMSSYSLLASQHLLGVVSCCYNGHTTRKGPHHTIMIIMEIALSGQHSNSSWQPQSSRILLSQYSMHHDHVKLLQCICRCVPFLFVSKSCINIQK